MKKLELSLHILKDYVPTKTHYEGLTLSLESFFSQKAMTTDNMAIRDDLCDKIRHTINREINLNGGPG